MPGSFVQVGKHPREALRWAVNLAAREASDETNSSLSAAARKISGGLISVLHWLPALCFAWILLSACTPSPRQTPAAFPFGTTEPVLFQEDFANPPSGWGTWSKGGASVQYDRGGLRIQVMQGQFDAWSVAGRKFADAQIEVDATRLAGPTDNDYGIICRYVDQANFYMLIVSSDGYYGIARLQDGDYRMIGADSLQYSETLAQQTAKNTPLHLHADCIGRTLRLSVNDQALLEVQDDTFTSGDVGVLAGTYSGKDVDILFDNFVVKKP